MTTLEAVSPGTARRARRLLLLAGIAIAIAIAIGVASAWAAHGRGTTLSVSLSPSGTATVVLDQRQAGSCTVGQAFGSGSIELLSLTGPGGTRSSVDTYAQAGTCRRTAGTFIEFRSVFTIDMSAMPDGWYVFRHTGGAKVGNIVNVNNGNSQTSWSSEAQFRKVAGQATGSPGFGVDLPFAAPIGFEYNQNLVASDPDGGAVTAASLCCNYDDPDFAVSTDVITTSGGSIPNQQIVIPSAATGTLATNQYLEFKVRVTDDDGEYSDLDMVLSPTTNAPPTLTPPAETTLTVLAGTSTPVPLSASDPNTGQTVTFAVSGQPSWVTISQTPGNPATGTLSVDPPPTTEGTFTFNVNASDDDSSLPSTSSFTMTVIVNPVSPVDAPGSVEDLGTVVSSNHVTVSWSPPLDDGGSPVTGYRVEYRLPGAATWTTGGTTDGSTTSVLVGPLSRGAEYEVRVIASNAVGDGAPATTTVTTLPQRPHPGSVTDQTVLDGETTTAPTYTGPGGVVVSIAPTPTGSGSWSTTADGAVYTAGDAPFHGSLSGSALTAPIVGITPTTSGAGYYLVGSDGGVFAFGDAVFLGSMGGTPLNEPVSAIVPTCSGRGYYLVAEDGGVFAFGDAVFHGSMGGVALNEEMLGIVPTCSGRGYWTYAADGGVFTFGDASFHGSLGADTPAGGIATMVPSSDDRGYWLVGVLPGTYPFGSAADR